jgi:hypothetical protein
MQGRPIGIIIVAVYAILSGLGEIVVGVTGNYLGILSRSMQPSFSTAVVGAFYCLAGLSLLTSAKRPTKPFPPGSHNALCAAA